MAKSATKEKAQQIPNEEFMGKAQPLTVKFGESMAVAPVREFKSGAVGWGCYDKVTIMVDGKPIKVQISLSLTVVGSKTE